MDVTVKRLYFCEDYTIGKLLVDDKYFCDTIEDKDRGLKQSMSTAEIKEKKVYGKTAIPTGKYILRMDIVSEKYKDIKWYKENCDGGRIPRLESVKGFSGVLIHPGNTEKDSLGCIIVGFNKEKGKVLKSKDTFKKLWTILNNAYNNKETIYLTVE